MTKGQKTYSVNGIPVVAGTPKAAMKKFRSLQHNQDVLEYMNNSAQVEAIAAEAMKLHHWYVDLVVMSKILEREGNEPPLDELKVRCARVHTPDGKEHITFDKEPLISYSRTPRFDDNNILCMDYLR